MSSIVFFEVSADDVQRAVKFYQHVFGWKIEGAEEASNYCMISTGDEDEGAIPGAVMERAALSESTVNTFDVPNLDSFAKKITEAGGEVIAPKISIPGVGYVQYCQDTEGNTFGIIEYDESAS
jgi:predicted enzyme related to lactoylglutathione lyase